MDVTFQFSLKLSGKLIKKSNKMSREGLLSFYVLILLKLLVHRAHGISRSLNNVASPTSTPQEIGLCESSVIKHGYQCKENYVTTKDGYILNIQRISSGRVPSGNITKQPVLMQHGLMVDGMTWLTNSPDENLPFILADNGFDVWISNTRGTRFSRQHTTLRPSQPEYWNWSWDELAANDLPALIEFVHKETGQKINYVGHSLGTLTALVSLSERLVVDKVKSTVLLSPIAYMDYLKSPVGDAAARTYMGELGSIIGLEEFNLRLKGSEIFVSSVCASPRLNCYDIAMLLTGDNCCLNASTAHVVLQVQPQSTSMKNLVHLAQIVRDRVVAKFDGPLFYNLKTYMAAKPPLYNLSNIPQDHPLFLSHGGIDGLSVVEDVKHLIDILKKSHDADKLKVQFVEKYGHLDFIMAVDAKDVVYNQVLSFFTSQH